MPIRSYSRINKRLNVALRKRQRRNQKLVRRIRAGAYGVSLSTVSGHDVEDAKNDQYLWPFGQRSTSSRNVRKRQLRHLHAPSHNLLPTLRTFYVNAVSVVLMFKWRQKSKPRPPALEGRQTWVEVIQQASTPRRN